MFKGSTWVIAGAAVLASAGVAHAQDRAPVAPAAAPGVTAPVSAVPWYQRFTTTNGVTEAITGETENDRLAPPAWSLSQRWGVTLDVREAQTVERLPESRGDQASVGAYYQFTPSMRVGGQLSVQEQPALAPAGASTTHQDEPAAGVRIESAFRF